MFVQTLSHRTIRYIYEIAEKSPEQQFEGSMILGAVTTFMRVALIKGFNIGELLGTK